MRFRKTLLHPACAGRRLRFLLGAALVGLVAFLPAVSAQTPPVTTPPPTVAPHVVSQLMQQFAPTMPPTSWLMRKSLGDAFDALTNVPPAVTTHPLLDPVIGPWLGELMRLRLDAVLDDLANGPPVVDGVRIYKLYSSSFIVRGPTRCLASDFSDFPFPILGIPSITPAQIQALAGHCTDYLISHPHADHYSVDLFWAMLGANKAVWVTPEVYGFLALVAPQTLPNIFVPPYGSALEFTDELQVWSFLGTQYGAFLDPLNVIPDLSHPAVQNNCFLFKFNGVTLAHFGDNNDVAVLPWCFTHAIIGGLTLHVAMNLGLWHGLVSTWFQPEIAILNHDHEFSHQDSDYILYGFTTTPPPPSVKFIMMWGEKIDVHQ